MSKETTPLGSSAPATGYATAVDAAIHLAKSGFTCARLQDSAKALGIMAGMKDGDIYSEVAAKVLADEVLRLQDALDFRGQGGSTYNKLCQAIVALPCCPLAGLIGEAAQELAAYESHNEKLSGALKKGEPNA